MRGVGLGLTSHRRRGKRPRKAGAYVFWVWNSDRRAGTVHKKLGALVHKRGSTGVGGGSIETVCSREGEA